MKFVVPFDQGHADMKATLGGKGANLAEMTRVGLPVPPGFTVTTDVCRAYYALGGQLPDGVREEVASALRVLESSQGKQFGDPAKPLLVSVRSGSVTSMPGMMDTILNLGLNDETVAGLAALTGDARFAYDCYRRLIQMFGNVVFQIESHHFESQLSRLKQRLGVGQDSEVSAEGWQELIESYRSIVVKETGRPFPQDVREQLELAVEAVFRSWNNTRAQVYRKIHRIPDEQGTAVNIQAMVFGNLGADSGTGVLFTRNPSTGERRLYGEYLINAQGEDVVAGVRTPVPIEQLGADMPLVFDQLERTAAMLEKHYKDMQDIEFTVEQGALYLLQTRSGKRTAQAAVKVAVDMANEGLISRGDAVERIEPFHLDQLLHRAIDVDQALDVLASGLPASPGAATGEAVFDADLAEAWSRAGRKTILVRSETTPEDIHGVLAAEGVLTSRGGMTSHAAVVARGMGKPCVCGCEAVRIEDRSFVVHAGGEFVTIREGDTISIDGSTGRVIRGGVNLREPELTEELQQLLRWADDIRTLQVYTNADTPEDAAKARDFGAEGIGLCRTEHMFMSAARVPVVQAMILADSAEERAEALEKLLPMQQQDFEGLFRAMDGLTVTIRLLDPPLHEFLPNMEQLVLQHERLRNDPNASSEEIDRNEKLLRKVRSLHEMNPMLGTRGCRLGLVLPEIYEMQADAIFRAVVRCLEEGIDVRPDIMIPLVGHANELIRMRELVTKRAEAILGDKAATFPYHVGTMIEVPRAAITAAQIAKHADFFSFGTNDLTQMTFGYSRDDAEGKFLAHYVETKLLPENPFQVLDEDGVGRLIEWAVEQGKAVKPLLKTGICGEHGGDKSSIFFCHAAGLNYVSCSPYRVPLARIAAAQAQLALGHPQSDAERSLSEHIA
ncbi:pyruvate, phosphate dikinase [Paenibacillus validus]|uniref:pyruvate, phosphate dikinase n=2 Tax=Paenibacillus validus TaxID=44253 RepID=UPI00158059D1|nr:pyruvate, phosphate dikinase [Paenibacillus validus]MED4602924.1 pyruvate, phosphate dikinase [Paenibacillus validus]